MFDTSVLLQKLIPVIEKICSECNLNLAQYQMKYAKRIIRSSIRQFYASYTPAYYHRRYSLYQMARPVIEGELFYILLGGEYSSFSHRIDENYIYENSFKQGFHGGAISGKYHPNKGTPYWRTPHPDYTSWGWPAYQTNPPYDYLIEEWNNFLYKHTPIAHQLTLIKVARKYQSEVFSIVNQYLKQEGVV